MTPQGKTGSSSDSKLAARHAPLAIAGQALMCRFARATITLAQLHHDVSPPASTGERCMSSQPIDELLLAAQRSGLIPAAEVEKLTRESLSDKFSTREDVAAELVNRQLLSSYQAELLLSGRGDEGIIAERYRILDKLGEGGMGAVYKAQDTRLDRLVAIKVLPPHSVVDPDAIARFQREARALAKLSHPNIVQAFDCGEDRGRHFLVMEFVEGKSLSHLLADRGRIAPTIAADYIHQAALGLEHAHERGLIHRDIKPGNLLLSIAPSGSSSGSSRAMPSYGQIKILDLGLARFLQDQIAQPQVTREGIGMGTPDYMAPEQFRDAHVADTRADIYSLGCTLFHLLTGRVPFPSSSLSQKFQAHAEQEPPPLEELCPEAPAGLVLVVQRMMAKLPAERFQTAGEVADALAPYVAGSSPSVGRLKATLSWKGGQLTSAHGRPGRRALRWSIASGAVVVVVVMALLGRRWLPTERTSAGPDNGGVLSGSGEVAGQVVGKPDGEPPKPKVVAIPNGLTVAKDGTGQFTSIRQALDRAKPGMTIRVLDKATYRESLPLTSPSRHAGLVLEAANGATLEVADQFGVGVLIEAVPRVTLRGFRMRAEGSRVVMVHVKTGAPGLLLEGLEMEPGAGVDYDGIYLERLNHAANDPPAIVQKCVLRRGKLGIAIHGMPANLLAVDGSKYPAPSTCSRIVVRENILVGFQTAILATGLASHLHIVGNRVWGGVRYAGIQFECLAANSENLLMANNTLLESAPAFRLWDAAPKGRGIVIRNNLVLGAALPDMLFIDSGGSPSQHRGPGDGKLIAKTWQMDHNWREVKEPQGQDIFSLSWIPPGEKDVRQDEIMVLSRDPDHADFLRPDKDSPLATAGAGGDLPGYVGAVPPEGASPWDWQGTWDLLADKALTVSKSPDGGGRFRSIVEAMDRVRPGMTVRVLDDGQYDEPMVIDDPARHAGIRLETTRQATIVLSAGNNRALSIRGVPDVRVSGFRFRDKQSTKNSSFILVQGQSPGVVLEDLDLEATGFAWGIRVLELPLAEQMAPVRIRRCKIKLGNEAMGIVVGVGTAPIAGDNARCGGVCITSSEVVGCQKGITLEGNVSRVLVAGNLLMNCSLAGLEITFPAAAVDRVLLANNTVLRCGSSFRVWEHAANEKALPGRVALKSNLFLEADFFDLAYILAPHMDKPAKSGDASLLYKTWQFADNFRDLSGATQVLVLLLSPGDKKVDPGDLVSRSRGSDGFLRPKADSPLAQGGAGKEDPSLPHYVGAFPAEAERPWDWDATWKALMQGGPE
jgi:serine/threonine protein kinase